VIACMEMRLRPARRAGPTTDTRRQTHSGVGVGVVATCPALIGVIVWAAERGEKLTGSPFGPGWVSY
jgi:hypothetical protein